MMLKEPQSADNMIQNDAKRPSKENNKKSSFPRFQTPLLRFMSMYEKKHYNIVK